MYDRMKRLAVGAPLKGSCDAAGHGLDLTNPFISSMMYAMIKIFFHIHEQ